MKGISQEIDSLKQALKQAVHDTVKVKIYVTLSEICEENEIEGFANPAIDICTANLKHTSPGSPLHRFYTRSMARATNNIGFLYDSNGENDKALEYYFKGLEIFRNIGEKKETAISLSNIGAVYKTTGQIKKALEYYEAGLKIQEEISDKKGMAATLINMGNIYQGQGDIPKSLECYHKSLKIFEDLGEKKNTAISLNNIGLLYKNQNNISKAQEYYRKSLKIREEIGDKKGIAVTLTNLGSIYELQNQYLAALEYHQKSLSIRQEIDDKPGIANSLNNIGVNYFKQNDLQKALEFYNKSLKIREKINEKQGTATTLNNLSRVYMKTGELNLAKQLAERSLMLSRELGFPENIKNSSELLSIIYSKSGQWQEAYNMHLLFKEMADSLNNESNRKSSVQKDFQYQYDKKAEADSIRANEEKRIFDVKMKQEKNQRITLYIGIVLIAIFSLFMYNRFRITRKQKNIIELKEKETQIQKHIISEKHKEITDSINYAERIQRSFLASKDLLDNNLKDYFVLFRPKDVVSGDFYWAFKNETSSSETFFYLATADSTGHGVPGAIMSLLNITSLEKAVEQIYYPHEILNHTRKTIIERLKKDGSEEGGKDGMDCSLIAFDFQKNKMLIAAANNPVWILRQNKVLEIKPDKMPVGKHDRQDISFSLQEFDLEPNDMIYTLTDGFPDQFGGEKGKKFMSKNLRELIASIAHLSMNEQKATLEEVFKNWVGQHEQIDDVTLIGIKI